MAVFCEGVECVGCLRWCSCFGGLVGWNLLAVGWQSIGWSALVVVGCGWFLAVSWWGGRVVVVSVVGWWWLSIA